MASARINLWRFALIMMLVGLLSVFFAAPADAKAKKTRVTSQPKSMTVTTGKTAAFAISATGSKLRYTWYLRKASWKSFRKVTKKYKELQGEHSKRLKVKYASTYSRASFRVVVRGKSGKATSKAAKLTYKTVTTAATSTPTKALSNPAYNTNYSVKFLSACNTNGATTQACINAAITDFSVAHAKEGLPSLKLPSNFGSLSLPKQELIVVNIERTIRGLAPIQGLNSKLNSAAATGASKKRDPSFPKISGVTWKGGSNWAGTKSPLLAVYLYMYNDGLESNGKSSNQSCTKTHTSGCWGHRRNILIRGMNNYIGGFGYANNSSTELFIASSSSIKSLPANSLTWSSIRGSIPQQ